MATIIDSSLTLYINTNLLKKWTLVTVPFPGFSAIILHLWHGFPLTRFFTDPKNRVKGEVHLLNT